MLLMIVFARHELIISHIIILLKTSARKDLVIWEKKPNKQRPKIDLYFSDLKSSGKKEGIYFTIICTTNVVEKM